MNKFTNQNKSRLQFSLMALLAVTCFAGAPASADDKAAQPPELVYDDIPASWDYYQVKPELLSKYKGEEVKELCFDDDIATNSVDYRKLRIQGNKKLKLMQGVRDFVVLGEDHLLVSTPETGIHIMETRFCDDDLLRAKYLVLPQNRTRRCFKYHKEFAYLKGYRNGIDGCRVESLHRWTGPMDVSELKAESDAMVIEIDADSLPENDK